MRASLKGQSPRPLAEPLAQDGATLNQMQRVARAACETPKRKKHCKPQCSIFPDGRLMCGCGQVGLRLPGNEGRQQGSKARRREGGKAGRR